MSFKLGSFRIFKKEMIRWFVSRLQVAMPMMRVRTEQWCPSDRICWKRTWRL